MSITSSMSSALLGLTATRRAAEVVSSNVANSLTEGYARRTLELSAHPLGGVKIDGVTREVDNKLIGDRRLAHASAGGAEQKMNALAEIEKLFGEPGEAGSLTSIYARFETALIEAASRPDVPARLDNVARAGVALSSKFEMMSDSLQKMRQEADQAIAREVNALNTAMAQVVELNVQIAEANPKAQDMAALMDQRQRIIDNISNIVPLRQFDRSNDMIALMTPTGAVLVDGPAAEVGFTAANIITPYMTQASGALSGLTLNDVPVNNSGEYSSFAGGSLQALFEKRDQITVKAQENLDMLARDLVERFQDSGLDTTLSAGDAGLFTDGGAAFVPSDEVGLSARLEFNPLVDLNKGGESWRLRDGLGAPTAGAVGNASLLQALSGRFNENRSSTSIAATGLSRTASGHAADWLSSIASERQASETEVSYQMSRFDSLRSAELAGGVDTDRELQELLVIEQAYAANAKVLQTIDSLIDQLMSI